MTDSTARFTGRAGDYASYRPAYPASIVAAILEGFPSPAIADLGAGTGISSMLLADAGAYVYLIEPNESMRAEIPSRPAIDAVVGMAEATTLDSGSVDIVTAFQAYHWFDPQRAMVEARRITRARSRFAAIWNYRDRDDGFTGAYEAIVDRYDISGGAIDRSRRSGTVASDLRYSGWDDVRIVEAQHEQVLDLDAVLGFVRSVSYVPKEGPDYHRMCAEVAELFADRSSNGNVRIHWIARAYLGDRSG